MPRWKRIRLKPPSDKIWLFDESFAKAFSAGTWEITTAKATIEVTKGKDGLSWRQVVVPDLGGERIGTWMKTGPDEVEFSNSPLFSQEAEAIYGWTNPNTQTNKDKAKRDLILIVGKEREKNNGSEGLLDRTGRRKQ